MTQLSDHVEAELSGPKGTSHDLLKFEGPTDFLLVWTANPISRVHLIKQGVPARTTLRLAESLRWNNEILAKRLGLGYSTIKRKIRNEDVLSTDEGERVVALAGLVGQVEAMVAESGQSEGFDAAGWVSDWLESPNPALNHVRPSEYLDTAEGRSIVSGLLAQMQSGTYA
jgi:putative toxin-antitoxin system antitoxin component (TIGR02293 family)